jgi:isopenicillin-N N-acyltransferase-like protein
MTLPIVPLSGTPHAQGLEHGRVLKDRIAHNVALYFERFEREVGLSRAAVHNIATQYVEAIAHQNPAYYAECREWRRGADSFSTTSPR